MLDLDHVQKLAEAEISGKASDEDRAFLEAHLEEWYLAMVEIARSIDDQSRDRESELEDFRVECLEREDGRREFNEARADHLEWRRRAMHFKGQVQKRMSQVKLERNRERDARFAKKLSEDLYAVTTAVQEHERRTREAGTPSEADLDLWSIVRATTSRDK